MGLTACLAVTTIALWITGRISLYINPDSAWFAVGMSVVALLGAIATFALPLGAEADHGHDHEHGHSVAPARARREAFAHADHDHGDAPDAHDAAAHDHLAARPRLTAAGLAAFSGGLIASGLGPPIPGRFVPRPPRCRPSSPSRATSGLRRCSSARTW